MVFFIMWKNFIQRRLFQKAISKYTDIGRCVTSKRKKKDLIVELYYTNKRDLKQMKKGKPLKNSCLLQMHTKSEKKDQTPKNGLSL